MCQSTCPQSIHNSHRPVCPPARPSHHLHSSIRLNNLTTDHSPVHWPLHLSVHPHLLTTHPPRTTHPSLLPCVVLNLWPPAFTAHILDLHVGPPGLFSVFHQSTHLSVPPSLHPFIPVSPSDNQPFCSASVSSAVLWVLVWPTLLTTETLNPRPRDTQETKSPVWGMESSQPVNQRP